MHSMGNKLKTLLLGFKFHFLMAASRHFLRKITVEDYRNVFRGFFPPLSFANHKGQAGRIAVVGGSTIFTGAPYYAAQAALYYGADLAFVFCDQAAAIPIKSYSPEIMVVPIDYENLWKSRVYPFILCSSSHFLVFD